MNARLGYGHCLANFHTHTTRCGHASGTEEQYVLQAIDSGFDCLGFAEHSAWPYKSDFVSDMRMHIRQLDDYVATIRGLEQKFSGQIRIYLGMECEAFPEFYPWLKDIRVEKGLDYLILGNHYDTNDEHGGLYFGRCHSPAELRRYVVATRSGMESGLFTYLAHPDLGLREYPAFDANARAACTELCQVARALNLPLEYNLLGESRNASDRKRGGLGYTTDEFWRIAAETGNRAIVGVDAHSWESLDCVDRILNAREKLSALGIRVEETIDEVEAAPCLKSAVELC